MAHNAYISKSPQRAPQSSSETTCGIRFESQKAWIYASEPAVMLETAQHVSVRMLSLIGGLQQAREVLERAAVEHALGLGASAGHGVADGPERRGDHAGLFMRLPSSSTSLSTTPALTTT